MSLKGYSQRKMHKVMSEWIGLSEAGLSKYKGKKKW